MRYKAAASINVLAVVAEAFTNEIYFPIYLAKKEKKHPVLEKELLRNIYTSTEIHRKSY